MHFALALLSLLSVATSTFAVTITTSVFTNRVCAIGQLAYTTPGGVSGGCGVPSTINTNPTYTRCPSFQYIESIITVKVNNNPSTSTTTYSCSTFLSRCPQGFEYLVASLTGLINAAVPLVCDRYVPTSEARTSCQRVGGTFVTATGICLTPSCGSSGCNPGPQNCRLQTSGNINSSPAACTAVGSICLNSNSPSYTGYSCGVPCNAKACYDNAPSVQVCDAANNRCAVCSTGARLDALTCSGAISGSQAPTRRRERLLKERKDKIAREHALCPVNLTACSIFPTRNGGYECLDTQSELESCGGCRSTGMGIDCSALTGVRMGAAICDRGRCIVSACRPGFKLRDGRCL